MAGKRSGLGEKEKEEKEQDFPLMARASHWICFRCSQMHLERPIYAR